MELPNEVLGGLPPVDPLAVLHVLVVVPVVILPLWEYVQP